MFELAYFEDNKAEDEVRGQIIKAFPEAKIKDASDEVHQNRFSVEMPDENREDFLVFSIKEGFGLCLLSINIMTMRKEEQGELKRLVALAGKESE